jgi:hypothetical protein
MKDNEIESVYSEISTVVPSSRLIVSCLCQIKRIEEFFSKSGPSLLIDHV